MNWLSGSGPWFLVAGLWFGNVVRSASNHNWYEMCLHILLMVYTAVIGVMILKGEKK